MTTLASESVISKNPDITVDVIVAVSALFIVLPIQFIFEFLCILLSKLKSKLPIQ